MAIKARTGSTYGDTTEMKTASVSNIRLDRKSAFQKSPGILSLL